MGGVTIKLGLFILTVNLAGGGLAPPQSHAQVITVRGAVRGTRGLFRGWGGEPINDAKARGKHAMARRGAPRTISHF